MKRYLPLIALALAAAFSHVAQAQKTKTYSDPAEKIIAAQVDEDKVGLWFTSSEGNKLVVVDKENNDKKTYDVEGNYVVVPKLPFQGYMSYRKETEDNIHIMASVSLGSITYAKKSYWGYLYAKAGGTDKSYMVASSSSTPSSSSTTTTLAPTVTKTPEPKKEETVVNKNPKTDIVKQEPKQSEKIEKTVPKEEEEKVVEIAKPVIEPTAANFEKFLEESDLKNAKINKTFALTSIENSDLDADKKSKKTSKVNEQHSADLAKLNSEKSAAKRKKTVEKIMKDYKISRIEEKYVVLEKEGEEWIFDDHYFLHKSSDVNLDGIYVDKAFKVEQKDNYINLLHESLACDLVITKSMNGAMSLTYGDVHIADFVNSKDYHMAVELDGDHDLLITSEKGYVNKVTLNDDSVELYQAKKAKKDGEDEKILSKETIKINECKQRH